MLATVAERPAGKTSLIPVSAPDPLRHRVLVVDDDPSFAQVVVESIVDSDIEVVSVEHPLEAIRLVQRQPVDAAVVDLVMPEMDGLELARELRRASPATEIVMLTGHADMHSAIEGIRNELFDYLRKDTLQAARLRRAVRAAIARSELRAENRSLLVGLKDSTRKLNVLSDLATRLAGEQHVDRVMAQLLATARELLECESVRIMLAERSELGDMTVRSVFGDGEIAMGTRCGPRDGIATCVLGTGEPLRVELPREHPSYSRRCDEMPTSLPGMLCAPFERPSVAGVFMAAGRSRAFTEEDLALLASLARQGSVAIENAQAGEENQNFFTHTSEMLVSLLDALEPHYQGHSHTVAVLADMVARRLGLPETERRSIHFAALLHDVGKLRLRGTMVQSARPLSADEVELVRQHPALGVEILRPISKWCGLAPIIHSHHERWDGRGYPRGLAGPDIPLGGRIVAVAEAFEAMTRPLPTRPPRSIEEALAEVDAHAGTQFDPVIARLFISEYRINEERLRTETA